MPKNQNRFFFCLKQAVAVSIILSLVYLHPLFFTLFFIIAFSILVVIALLIKIMNSPKLVICFFCTCFISVVLFRNYTSRITDSGCNHNPWICAAKSDIPENTLINTEHITYRSIPLKYIPEKALFWKDRAKLIGVMTTQKIKTRECLFFDMFRELTPEEKCRTFLPEGLRIVSFPISKMGSVSGLCSGDKVDIIASFQIPNKSKNAFQNQCTMTVLSNVEIKTIVQNFDKSKKYIKTSDKAVTFYLKPSECEILTYLLNARKAKLTLVLRNADEPNSVESTPITKENIEQEIQKILQNSHNRPLNKPHNTVLGK